MCEKHEESPCWEKKRKTDDCGSLVIVEAERGFIHICTGTEYVTGHPSLCKEGWESIFLGSDGCISATAHKVVGLHIVGPYLLVFQEMSSQEEVMFQSYPLVRTPLEHSLLSRLIDNATMPFGEISSAREGLTDQLNRIADHVAKHIRNTIPEMTDETQGRLSEIVAHRSSVLGPIIPILMDELTEEVFLDNPGNAFYFDHQTHGRCTTLLVCEPDDASEIVTMLRAQSNLHLDSSNPSLKTDLSILGVPLRISASIPPLSPDGLHLELRRARFTPFGLADLVKNGTLSQEAAALLVLAIANRFNITVTGEPGSGKTTLLNALDMVVPKKWRRVYVEDALESREISSSHQVRFRVDPVDEQSRQSSKSDEIVKCLHRSPDYVVLGEIQTKEHSEALFHALSAGLRVIQTCHSSSASALISRWNISHGIAPVSIALMDLVVTLQRPKPTEPKRVVTEIAEVCRTSSDGLIRFSGLNCVYSGEDGLKTWNEDGAFLRRARESGHLSHLPALEGLMGFLEKHSSGDAFENACDLLWKDGHPMGFDWRNHGLGL